MIKSFQDAKLLFELEQRGNKETLDERSLTLVSGLDYVNLTATHIVAMDVQTSKVVLKKIESDFHLLL